MQPDTTTRAFTEADRFAVFVWLFAGFSLTHEIIDARLWITKGPVAIAGGIAAMLAAALVLAAPRDARRLALMALALITVKIDAMPYTPNHVLFTSLICLALFALAATKGRTSAWLNTGARTIAPPVRVALCIVYGFAVLHKLNHDYFDPAASCGPALFRELRHYLPFLPHDQWINWPAIVGSLATEGGLGLFLLFRRTRTPAITVGLLFHALLAFHPNVYIMSFSTLIIPLYALFLPLPIYERIAQLPRLLPARIAGIMLRPPAPLRYAPLAAVVILLAYAGAVIARSPDADAAERITLVSNALGPIPRTLGLGFVFAGSAVFFLAIAVRPASLLDRDPPAAPPYPAWPVALLSTLVTFNGFCPYLGLKTQTSFSMFSNLRTEVGRTNHFFMPTTDLTGYTDDLVTIQASTNPTLTLRAEAGELVPFFELRRIAANDPAPDFAVLFTPLGRSEPILAERSPAPGTTTDPKADAVFDTPPLLLRKVMGFRPVPPLDEPCTCRH